MAKFKSFICAGLLAMLAGMPALGASGTAVGVDPDAEARGKGTRTLVVGADIFIGDRIVTDARGLVQIIFSDQTRLVVGPRSSLVIEDHLLRENGSAGRFAVNALSGTFRFITGDGPKDRYTIKTPTGQIGVRGTAFDLSVSKPVTYVMQLHGATINCSNSGDCETMRTRCEIIELTRSDAESLGRPGDMRSNARREARGWFPFVASQRGLMRPFRVSNAESCLKSGGDAPPASLGDINILDRHDNDSSDRYD